MTASVGDWSPASRNPSACAMAGITRVGSVMAASGTKTTPSA
jgi:hypothetical protein